MYELIKDNTRRLTESEVKRDRLISQGYSCITAPERDLNNMNKSELIELCNEENIEVKNSMNKAELLALLGG